MANAPAKKRRARSPPFPDYGVVILPEERQDPLFRLAGEGQGLDAQLLAGLQGQQVGAFLVEVGQGQLAARGIMFSANYFLPPNRELVSGLVSLLRKFMPAVSMSNNKPAPVTAALGMAPAVGSSAVRAGLSPFALYSVVS